MGLMEMTYGKLSLSLSVFLSLEFSFLSVCLVALSELRSVRKWEFLWYVFVGFSEKVVRSE